MLQVIIVGDRDSGKTTFLGLLYSSQVRSGSDAADDFRFHVAIESIDEISGVFQQLMSGSFPDSHSKEGIHEMRFHIGYRKPGFGIRWRPRSRGWTPADSTSLHLILMRNLAEEISRFLKGSSLANVKLRDVLASDAIVILVDSRKLAVTEEGRELGPIGKYDSDVHSLLTAIQRSREHSGRQWLHLIFIFTKFDSVDPEALRVAKVEGEPPKVKKTGPRTAYGQALLDHNLPKTMARVRALEPRGLKFTKPSYFFSWVRTEEAAPGRRERVRLRHAGAAGWEPDYSKDEYHALLERLSKIAANARK